MVVLAAVSVSAYKQIESSDSSFVLLGLGDALEILFDERKTSHFVQAEISFLEAIEGSDSGDYEKIHSSFETAVSEMSDAVGENSALTLMILEAQSAAENRYEKWKIVEQLSRRILKAVPKTKKFKQLSWSARYMLRSALQEQGKYDQALQAYTDEVALTARDDISADKVDVRAALSSLAEFYTKFQVYDKAFETQQSLLVLVEKIPKEKGTNRRVAKVLLDMAELKRAVHEFPAANALYVRAIESNPTVWGAYSQRGYMYKHDLHQYPLAIADYTKAIELCEEYEKKRREKIARNYRPCNFLYFRRAVAYSENKNYEEALRDYSFILANDSEYAPAYPRRGETCSKMGAIERALTDFDKAKQALRGSNSASMYMLRGDANRRAERYSDALSDYEQSLVNAPGDPRPYINRAAMREQLGKHETALADYAKAEKCLAQYGPKKLLKNTIEDMPEWKERMAFTLYDGRAKVYDALKKTKLAAADRAKAKLLAQSI
jgi:tetratricopeptide (TPR) repeat protein